MDLTQLLNSNVGKDIISGISNQTQTNEQDTASVINAAAPVLMGMLQKNASTPEGAQSLQGALQEHDGNILSNISTFLGAGGDTTDGNNILGHILGNNRNTVKNNSAIRRAFQCLMFPKSWLCWLPLSWVSWDSRADSKDKEEI